MQDTSGVASELLSLRRPQGNKASNASDSDSEKLKMALAEKNIAETMFATAFKEKEIIRLQAIKAVDLLKNQLKKSERAVAEAAYQIADLCKKIDADALHNSVNEEEIHNLHNRNTILRNEASMAVINQFNEQATWRDSIVIDKCCSQVTDSSVQQSSAIAGAEEVDEAHQLLGLKCSAFESEHQISQSLDGEAVEALKHRICLLKSKLSIKTRAISIAARNQETEALANSMSASDEMNKMKDVLTEVQNDLALATKSSDDKSFQILQMLEKFNEVKGENKAFDLEVIEMINEKNLLQNECATLKKDITHSKNVLETESSAANEAEKISSLLIKNLMSEIVEKENNAKKLVEEQQEISEKMNDIVVSRNHLEKENSGLKIENKRLITRLYDVETSSNVTSKCLTDEYISVCSVLTEKTVEIAALHGEILEQNREVQGLGLKNGCLQNQLNQVVMEKNLKEEQTVPFLEQIMVLQKAHSTQRDSDSAVIEQLEHLSQELQSANTELSSNLAHIIADNDSLRVLDKEQKKIVLDREMMCVSLQDNLLLSEAALKKRNSTIIDMSQQMKILHATAEESVALHSNDGDKSRENETLQASVLYLQNQLEQVVMEKNLKEEQTVPFLEQIMVLQKAHITQRNEDSAVIEQLEHTNRVLKSEINNRQTLKFSKNDDDGEEEFFSDNESKIFILNDSLILSEQRTEQAERSLLFLTAKLGMRDDDLIIANDCLSKNRKDIRTLKSKIALLNTDLEYSRITIDQNKNKINSIEIDNTSLNSIITNQKKMLFDKDTIIFQVSENSSLAEMKVDLMITVIRAEIKFMNLLLEDSRSIDFNILSRELGVLNGLAGTGSDEISTIICDFNVQNNKMFVNMREKKENIDKIIRLNKSMTVSCDKNTHALELNEILQQHELEIMKLNERYNTLNNQLKDTERLHVMKEEKEHGEKDISASEFENKTESLTIALEEMEEEMQFVSTSLEQSLKINENLTLSEANLREELMNILNNNTEEINILLHTHNDTIQKFDEKIIILEKQNKELKDKINQKSILLKKQQRGIKQGIKVISDDEESELEDEDTIDINRTQYAFTKNPFNRKTEDYEPNTSDSPRSETQSPVHDHMADRRSGRSPVHDHMADRRSGRFDGADLFCHSDGVRSVTQSPRSMLFQSPEGSATKPQYRIDSVYTGPGIERHERVREELDGLGADADNDNDCDGENDGDKDTHTKPGGLFHDVYVDLIPKEEAETVCAFVSPTHSLDSDTLALTLTTHSKRDRSRNGNKDGNGTGTAPILHPSAFLSPVRTSSAGDIDCELRARLQAIEKDRLALISPDIKSSQRPTNQLTYRLDVLQKELNKKSEESNYFQTNFYGLKENLDTKNDENKELRGKVFSLEEKNLNLEQELSSYRTLHLNYDNKENKIKDKKGNNEIEIIKDESKEKEKGKDKEIKKIDEKKIQATKNKITSKAKYEDKNKNIVSPEN